MTPITPALQIFNYNWLKVIDPNYMSTYYEQEMQMESLINRTEKIIFFNLVTFDLIENYVTKQMWVNCMGQSY
jgi:hypothetical protein